MSERNYPEIVGLSTATEVVNLVSSSCSSGNDIDIIMEREEINSGQEAQHESVQPDQLEQAVYKEQPTQINRLAGLLPTTKYQKTLPTHQGTKVGTPEVVDHERLRGQGYKPRSSTKNVTKSRKLRKPLSRPKRQFRRGHDDLRARNDDLKQDQQSNISQSNIISSRENNLNDKEVTSAAEALLLMSAAHLADAAPMVPAAVPIVPAAAPMVPAAAPMVPAAAPMVPAAAPMVPAAVPMVPVAAPMVPAAAPMVPAAAAPMVPAAVSMVPAADAPMVPAAAPMVPAAPLAAAVPMAILDDHKRKQPSCEERSRVEKRNCTMGGHATATFASLTALPTAISPIPGASSHSHALPPTVPTAPSSLTPGATPSPPQHAKNSPPNPNARSATDSASAGAAAAPPSPPPNSIPSLIPTSPSANATHSPGHPSHHNKILDTYISMMSANMQPHEALAKMAPMLSTLDDNNLLSLALMTEKACINLRKLAEALFNRFANQVNLLALQTALGNGRNQGSMPVLLAPLGNGMNQGSIPALLAPLGNGMNQGSIPALLAPLGNGMNQGSMPASQTTALGNGMNQGSMPALQAPHCFPSSALVSNNISVGGASGVINVTTIPPSESMQRPDISNSASSDSASLQTDMQQQARDPDTFWMVDD